MKKSSPSDKQEKIKTLFLVSSQYALSNYSKKNCLNFFQKVTNFQHFPDFEGASSSTLVEGRIFHFELFIEKKHYLFKKTSTYKLYKFSNNVI